MSSKVSNLIVIIAISVVLVPFIILGDDYTFTVHDYLDSYPGWMYIVQNIPAIPRYDESSGIMGDMPAFYFYREINIYMLLNHYFGFVTAEFINRFLTIVIGFFSMKYLLQTIFKDKLDSNVIKLISVSYAISPVFPAWSLGFAILPVLIGKLIKYSNNPQEKITWRMLPFLGVGLGGTFACLGLFVCIIWCCAIIYCFKSNKMLNKALIVSLFFMIVGYSLTNSYLFVMALSGVETNRTLMVYDPISWKTPYHIIKNSIIVLLHGQYHAAPILTIIRPVCIIGLIIVFIGKRMGNISVNECKVTCTISKIFALMFIFSLIYALDEKGIDRILLSPIMPILKGFNLGRIVYINNVLWYVLFALILSMIIKKYNRIIGIIVVMQIMAVILANGPYQDTRNNIMNCFAQRNNQDKVGYQRFIAPYFWSELKKNIDYKNEGVVSVGIHPSVAMANGFNTIDGYLSTHPMSWHNEFREIVKPTFEKYDKLEKYYDRWGGRMYVYADDTNNTAVSFDKVFEQKELLINVEFLKKLGGKYILSKYDIKNADKLGVHKIYEQDIEESIYHIYVYEVD